jgi:hypothetical protein
VFGAVLIRCRLTLITSLGEVRTVSSGAVGDQVFPRLTRPHLSTFFRASARGSSPRPILRDGHESNSHARMWPCEYHHNRPKRKKNDEDRPSSISRRSIFSSCRRSDHRCHPPPPAAAAESQKDSSRGRRWSTIIMITAVPGVIPNP